MISAATLSIVLEMPIVGSPRKMGDLSYPRMKAASPLEKASPRGFAQIAWEFLVCAETAKSRVKSPAGIGDQISHIPLMFLFGRSIEIALKSYLLMKGMTVQDLSNELGHNLQRCLNQAEELGLKEIVRVTPRDRKLIQALNGLYSCKHLEYGEGPMRRIISPDSLEGLTKKFLFHVARAVDFALPENANTSWRKEIEAYKSMPPRKRHKKTTKSDYDEL